MQVGNPKKKAPEVALQDLSASFCAVFLAASRVRRPKRRKSLTRLVFGSDPSHLGRLAGQGRPASHQLSCRIGTHLRRCTTQYPSSCQGASSTLPGGIGRSSAVPLDGFPSYQSSSQQRSPCAVSVSIAPSATNQWVLRDSDLLPMGEFQASARMDLRTGTARCTVQKAVDRYPLSQSGRLLGRYPIGCNQYQSGFAGAQTPVRGLDSPRE